MSTSRFRLALAACCLAGAVALSANDTIAPTSSDASAKVAASAQAIPSAIPAAVKATVGPSVKALPPVKCESVPEYVGPEYVWYLRTMVTLDCVNAIASRELEQADTNGAEDGGVVTVPRELFERIRDLTVTAQDAAARIGR